MALPPLGLGNDPTDPFVHGDLYEGVLARRLVAVSLDWLILLVIAGAFWLIASFIWVLTFGLAAPLLVLIASLLPIAYHSLLISGRSAATVGMRAMGVQAYAADGRRPTLLQAAIHTIVFYVSISATAFLILLLPLFDRRRRTLHDLLSGIVILRTTAGQPRLP